MPKVYLRRIVNPETQLAAYEVVDGQQRLRACLDFHNGKLVLRKQHNPGLGDSTFNNLPEAAQRSFLEYEISTEVMEDATDAEVWGMFERLNSYTITLNRQEKLNAKWFGYFKQTAYHLAAEQPALDAWKRLGVFTDKRIARMREVELTSDVLVAFMHGISDISKISAAYEEFDSDFPQRNKASRVFRKSLSYLKNQTGDAIRETRFRRIAWFYSLMVATIDAQSGIPEGFGPKPLQPKEKVSARMRQIDDALKSEELRPNLADLHAALSRGTSHTRERGVRHEHFFSMLTLSERSWNLRWK